MCDRIGRVEETRDGGQIYCVMKIKIAGNGRVTEDLHFKVTATKMIYRNQ